MKSATSTQSQTIWSNTSTNGTITHSSWPTSTWSRAFHLDCFTWHSLGTSAGSIPRWLGNHCYDNHSMVVLGIGDSFAAIIGSIHGSRKLMNSSKTLEGLAAFIASSLIFLFHLYLITSALSWPICDQISITSNSISIDYQLIAIIVGMGFVEVSTQ
jgi:hypothetical protein